MNEKSVTIVLEGRQVKVEFKGVWRRVDIDTAHIMMLNELPKHLLKIKQGGEYERRDEQPERIESVING